MSWMHKQLITKDPTPNDFKYRVWCEMKYMIRADPAERGRYPAGYWRECWAHWNAVNPRGDFPGVPVWVRMVRVWWRDVVYVLTGGRHG